MAMVSLATSSLVLVVKGFKKPGGILSNKLHSLIQALMFQTILSCELHSFLSVPILHTHQVQYSMVQYSSLQYTLTRTRPGYSRGGGRPASSTSRRRSLLWQVDRYLIWSRDNSVSVPTEGSGCDASNGVSEPAPGRVRGESGPCVALLVCLVNKWVHRNRAANCSEYCW